jgi:predicted ATPase/class 3 adenylate cyclase
MAEQPPSGTVTFLLTDLEGSTQMWEQEPQAMKDAMVRHDELLEKSIAANQGFVFARMGDGMAASFATARDAVCAAAGFKQALEEEPWRTARPLRARVGLHTDEAVIVDDTNYASLPINRCSRLMTAAHGGQVVVSGSTEMLMRGQLPDGMELVDLGEHRLRDLGGPTRIFQLVREGGHEEFPPLRTLDSFPGNLPAQVSSFIGRETDAARVAKALEESRVVTVTGVGGVGKTRLALQVAADLLPRYREGAWLVELAQVRDPAGVAEAVASAFHLTNRGRPLIADSLIEVLAEKQLLLVLDNCEHVLGELAPLVRRIEATCPGVVMLATSREGIAIDGEQLIALPPLAVGEPGEDLEQLIRTDAVSLFVERARQVKADFQLTASNRQSVVEICQRLDGVPLAIELAAARVIALSPSEIARRLDRRFQLLAGGRRGAVERHATLRAAIDWSYELLSTAEQRVLGRLSVFSGGSTLEAVEEICCGGPVDRGDVLNVVTDLVARSLVIAEDAGLDTRYRVLETIRQYGEERLAEWDETLTLRVGHARFYTSLCARAAQNFYGPDQLEWARRLNHERDNIKAALATVIDCNDTALAVQLVADHPDGQSQDVSHVGELFTLQASRVLEMPGAADEPGYSRVLMVAAHQALHNGDYRRANDLCEQALSSERRLRTALPGPRIEVGVSALQALRSLSAGAYTEAAAAYARAAELAAFDNSPGLAAMYLAYSINSAVLGGGSSDEAIALAEEAVAMARQSDMPTAIAVSLNALALALVERDPARARSVAHESLQRSVTPGEEMSTAVMTASLVAARLQDWDLTLSLTVETMRLWRWVNSPMQSAPSLALCARAIAHDRPELAGVLRGAAYAAFHRAGTNDSSLSATDASTTPEANFVLMALRETGDIVAAVLGEERRRELRTMGAAMTMDEAISYALANVDPKLLTNPIANIER